MTERTATPAINRPMLAISLRSAVVGGIGAVLLLVSPLGPGWLFTPANPAFHIPAATLDFSDLHHLTSSGIAPTNWVQQNYFSWLGWLLIALTIVATGAAVLVRRRFLIAVAAVLSVLGLVVDVFADKGVLTWSQFYREVPNLRIGTYLLIAGYLLTLLSALIPERG